MIKKRYIALALMLLLINLNSNGVYANSCKMDIIKEFANVENSYKVSYRYNIEKQSYTLILNYHKDKNFEYKIYDKEDIECEQINKTTKECHNFQPGKYGYEIYGENENCLQVVKVLEVEIKKLSNYSTDPICNGIEEFVLCQEDYYKEIDYETFISRANTYKRTKQKKQQKEEIEKQQNQNKKQQAKIKIYIEENLSQIIITGVFIILVIITIIVTIRTEKKSRRLEW